jgi:hypothetical protein
VGAGGAGRNSWGLMWFFPPLLHCICIRICFGIEQLLFASRREHLANVQHETLDHG